MKINVIIGIIVVIAVCGGLWWKSKQNDAQPQAQQPQQMQQSQPAQSTDPYGNFISPTK